MAFFGLTLACLIKFMHLLSLLVQHAFLSLVAQEFVSQAKEKNSTSYR